MHLTRLSIAGWRSFSPDAPFVLDDLGRINILLGPNGVGKSNVGRFALWLSRMLADINQGPGHPTYAKPALLHAPFDRADSWGLLGGPISATLGVDPRTLPAMLKCPQRWLDDQGTLDVRLSAQQQDGGLWWATFQPFSAAGAPFFRVPEDGTAVEVLGAELKYLPVGAADELGIRNFALGLCEVPPRSWLHVHALRHPEAEKSLGTTVRASLVGLFHNEKEQPLWAYVRAQLEDWLRRLLGERVIVDVPGSDVRLTRTGTALSLPLLLRDAGDGVAQYFYLLAALLLHPFAPALVFIDEPEAHLHPGALLELLRIIDQDLPHVQLLIATHSSAVVDALSPDWHFWRVTRDENGASLADRVDTQARRIAALDALGVSASQIFMARTVVWVEGPSDVVYYRALFAAVDPDLVAGRDYAFAMFGGSNGTHFALDGDGSLDEVVVDVLRLAHRNVFIHDKDRSKSARERVARWKAQIVATGVSGAAFSTPGREVENLVEPSVLLAAVVKTVAFIIDEGKKLNVVFDGPLDLQPGAAFAPALAACARRNRRAKLSEGQRHRVVAQIETKKHLLAREVVASAATAHNLFSSAATKWAKRVVASIRR